MKSITEARRKYLWTIAIGLLAITICTQSCYNRKADVVYPKPVTCDTTNVRYSVEVVNILKDNCYVCHAPGFVQGGIVLNNYTAVKNLVNNGKLFGSIDWLSGFSRMPKNQPKLNDCNIATIRTWIRNGAPNN